MSNTVTLPMQVPVFPLTSLTVNVTATGTVVLEQLNVVAFKVNEPMPQASEQPLFNWDGVIVTVPFGAKFTEMFWQAAVGAVMSRTVTVAEHELVLEFNRSQRGLQRLSRHWRSCRSAA